MVILSFLEIKNVHKNFTQQDGTKLNVLNNINLNINNREFITFIGPSGCGKSTLLNILAGLIKPDKGQIKLKDRTIQDPGNDRVMVFQESSLFPWLTVIENVMFGLKAKNMDKETAYNKALKQLKAVHLSDFKDSYPHQISGGMKQRAAIARALVINPEILLMDEPFGSLDEQTRIILHQELMKLWQKTKKTIVFVTHNIREAVKLSDRIIVLGSNPGRIIEQIPINVSRPRNKENPQLINLENKILQLLQNEINPVGDYGNEVQKIAT